MRIGRSLAVLVLVAAAACGGPTTVTSSAGPGAATATDATAGDAGTRLVIATTVAPITSITAAIVGDRADVRGIVPEGTSSHTFEPPPSTAELLSDADIVFLNGLQLEEPTQELAEQNRKEGAQLVELGPQTIPQDRWVYDVSFPADQGRPNPHLWTDPLLARRYAEIVRDTVVARDPADAGAYRANFDRYAAQLAALDQAMRTSFATIPADQRKLLTYHDAYAYFAQDYGWQVVGAIQVADFDDPSPKEVAALVDQVREQQVRAIFGSEVFPSPVLEQIGRETGVRYVDELRDDDLPEAPGHAAHTLVGLLRVDYVTMTEALGGDASALRGLDVAPTAPDRAEYPQ